MAGRKKIPLIERKRIYDEVLGLRKKMSTVKACESLGIKVSDFWNNQKLLKRSGLLDDPKLKDKKDKTEPALDNYLGSKHLIKIFLQDATFALSSGTFEVKDGGIEFEGKGTIKIDSK